MMNKLELKAFLINLKQNFINEAESDYNEYLSEIKQLLSDTEDIDDHSHIVENGEKTQYYESQMVENKRNLELIENISFEPMSEIDLGAVVKVNDSYYVIATAEPKFMFENNEFIGISVSAPIYAHLRGKKVGDSFDFNGKKFHINEVY